MNIYNNNKNNNNYQVIITYNNLDDSLECAAVDPQVAQLTESHNEVGVK